MLIGIAEEARTRSDIKRWTSLNRVRDLSFIGLSGTNGGILANISFPIGPCEPEPFERFDAGVDTLESEEGDTGSSNRTTRDQPEIPQRQTFRMWHYR